MARTLALDMEGALQQLGAKRVEAALLACLLRDGPIGTKEIVDKTGLRQPEVSVGMQVLRDRDWVEAEAVPRSGKGRPMHKYRLVADAAKIRRHYEEQGTQAIAQYRSAMDALRGQLG